MALEVWQEEQEQGQEVWQVQWPMSVQAAVVKKGSAGDQGLEGDLIQGGQGSQALADPVAYTYKSLQRLQ